MIVYQRNGQELHSYRGEMKDFNRELAEEFMDKFDNEKIEKLEITFEEDVLVQEIHALQHLDKKRIKSVIVTLKALSVPMNSIPESCNHYPGATIFHGKDKKIECKKCGELY